MKTEGNCIDKFIEKKVDKQIYDILKLVKSIGYRIDERTNSTDYFTTGCYENDFTDIRKIKELSIELTNNCQKFLERISEQYSKLN